MWDESDRKESERILRSASRGEGVAGLGEVRSKDFDTAVLSVC